MMTLLNLAAGALLKLITGGFSLWMDFKRQKELAILAADQNKIVALQSGTDKADASTRWTRRVLALAIIGTWVYIMWYVAVTPNLHYDVFVSRDRSWLWGWLWPFPVNEKGISQISGGALLWEFKTMVEIVVGFYFTKIGK